MINKINNNIFINLESFLDMKKFYSLEESIDYNLAKNYVYTNEGTTCEDCLYDKNFLTFTDTFRSLKLLHPELNDSQLSELTKFKTCNLGKILFVKKITTKNYDKKHLKEYASSTNCEKDFKFLIDWIDDQECFTEYGRIMFFLNEPNQTTAVHRDYSVFYPHEKDMFIWLTGMKKRKRLFVLDPDTNVEYENIYRACLFENDNYHYSRGIENLRSWSLRIDGIFNRNWAKKVGIENFFFSK